MNILVTGASKGIGNAIAQELQNVGEVYVTGRNEQALAACNAKGFCICDLSKDVNNLANFIIEKNIDVLINNAGEYIYSGLETMNIADIQRLYQTNLIAPAYLISKAIPHMKGQKWGRIINIGSISGVWVKLLPSIYSSSKAGLIGLTKGLALELAEYNITVNTINPGWSKQNLEWHQLKIVNFQKKKLLIQFHKNVL